MGGWVLEAREGIYLGLNREGTIIIAINLIIDMIAVHMDYVGDALRPPHVPAQLQRGPSWHFHSSLSKELCHSMLQLTCKLYCKEIIKYTYLTILQ